MDEQRRRYYLQALGVQPWVLKEDTIADEAPEEPAVVGLERQEQAPQQRPSERLQEAVQSVATPPVAEEPATPKPIADVIELPPLHTATLGWEALQGLVDNCQRCELHKLRTQAVFGTGDKQADLMVIGEAPGADEDARGEPFVGKAGQLLTKMLQAIDLQRSDVYIANILKSRPPNNRNPNPQEVAACIPYLERQIELVRPKVIMCVGKVAIANLLKTEQTVGRLRGDTHSYQGIPLIVTYHPAYLLRNPIDKRKAYDDLLRVQALLSDDS